MPATVLAEYAGAAAASHVVSLGAPTAGRPVLVWAAAAAVMSAAPAGWVRDVYLVSQTAGAVYRLPGAANDGSVLSLQIDLTGGGSPASRALSAVVLELDSDGEPRVDFSAIRDYVASAVQPWSGSVPAAGDGESTLAGALLCAGTFYVAEIPAVASWVSPLLEVGDSGTVVTTAEDARVSVAGTDAAFSGALSVTYTASWNAGGVGAVYRYTPSGAVETSGAADLGGLTAAATGAVGPVAAAAAVLGGMTAAAVALTSAPVAATALLGGLVSVAVPVVPTAGFVTAMLRTAPDLEASLSAPDDMLISVLAGGDYSMTTGTLTRSWLSREPVVWTLTLASGDDLDPSTVDVAFVPAGTDLEPDDADWSTVTATGGGTATVTVSVLVGPTGDTTAEVALARGFYDLYVRPTLGDQAPVRAGHLHLT